MAGFAMRQPTMSMRTVQKHLEHIFQKLGVENRTAAAARFWEVTYRLSGMHRVKG
jgi:DNA-binding NarL/FixJ family response regulator